MAESEKIKNMSVEDYLTAEECSNVKHEYVRGRIFAMSGATEAHNIICGNLHAVLHAFVKGTGCRVFMNDMKVNVEAADSFYYPDIMVTCEPFDAKCVFKNSPTLIAEVLSPSTKQIDRREKLVAYQQLNSLCNYILVHQNQALIEVYRRVSNDQWVLEKLQRMDELCLDAIAGKSLRIPVSTIYDDVVLPSIVKESDELYELV